MVVFGLLVYLELGFVVDLGDRVGGGGDYCY